MATTSTHRQALGCEATDDSDKKSAALSQLCNPRHALQEYPSSRGFQQPAFAICTSCSEDLGAARAAPGVSGFSGLGMSRRESRAEFCCVYFVYLKLCSQTQDRRGCESCEMRLVQHNLFLLHERRTDFSPCWDGSVAHWLSMAQYGSVGLRASVFPAEGVTLTVTYSSLLSSLAARNLLVATFGVSLSTCEYGLLHPRGGWRLEAGGDCALCLRVGAGYGRGRRGLLFGRRLLENQAARGEKTCCVR